MVVRPDCLVRRCDARLDRIRNIFADRDPGMALPLRVIVPATVVCALYTVCRVYFYVEDFMSLRVQPVGIFVTANQFVPSWGNA